MWLPEVTHPFLLKFRPKDGEACYCSIPEITYIGHLGVWFEMSATVQGTLPNKMTVEMAKDCIDLQCVLSQLFPELTQFATMDEWDAFFDNISDKHLLQLIGETSSTIRHIKNPTDEMKRLHAMRYKI